MFEEAILHHVASVDESISTLTTSVKAALVASLCHASADSIAVEMTVNAVCDVATSPDAHGRSMLEQISSVGIVNAWERQRESGSQRESKRVSEREGGRKTSPEQSRLVGSFPQPDVVDVIVMRIHAAWRECHGFASCDSHPGATNGVDVTRLHAAVGAF
jgi:hypothetical protein